jgi:hypothetical protein
LSEALDPLSRLADAEFSPDVAKMLADNVLKDNSMEPPYDKLDDRTLFRLKALRNPLCGFPVTLIEAMFR